MTNAVEVRYRDRNNQVQREIKSYEGNNFNQVKSEMIALAKDKVVNENAQSADVYFLKRITGYKAETKRTVVQK